MSYMLGFIYVTRCIPTGKLYVGFHTKHSHRYLGSGVLLNKAIRKYGFENFKRTELEMFRSLEEGFALEKKWILTLNSKSPIGYNLTDGGEGLVNPCQETRDKIRKANSHPLTENHRVSLSLAHLGVPLSEEHKAHMRGHSLTVEHKAKLLIANLGNLRSKATRSKISLANKGKHRTDEQRARIGASLKEKPWSLNRRRAQELRRGNHNFIPTY